jgi:ATP-dependent DNA ligase
MHKSGDGVGSLLLGVYDDEGNLHHVGVATSFTAKRRAELLDEIGDLRGDDALDDHPWREWAEAEAHARETGGRMPGAPSRWNAQKDMTWEPLRIERVVEAAYEGLLSGRFRHSARFVRWRPDRTPSSCTYDQFEALDTVTVDEIFT